MNKCVLAGALCALIVLAAVLQSWLRPEPVDTHGWDLARFVAHLHAADVQVNVVPTCKSGGSGNSILLSEDPAQTWDSFQVKRRNLQHIGEWQGAAWVEHLQPEAYIEWYVDEWGRNGCRIGDFVVFGDDHLIDRILRAFNR